jgi:putative restriction endonuclease
VFMPIHDVNISSLPDHHRRRLQWFSDNSGTTQPLPEPVADGPLITRAKGIYKPAGLEYALSVRVMVSSPYADKAVERHPGGGWSLQYFQENPDPSQKMQEYTNRGLDYCQQDRVPVGVLVQVSTKPARYDVLGLALVVGWEAGFFALESARLD